MDELIERTRLAAKILRDIGGQSAMAATVEEAAAALEAAREDAERIVFLMPGGRDEPNDADLIEGYRRMIDSARAIDQARGKGGGEVEGG